MLLWWFGAPKLTRLLFLCCDNPPRSTLWRARPEDPERSLIGYIDNETSKVSYCNGWQPPHVLRVLRDVFKIPLSLGVLLLPPVDVEHGFLLLKALKNLVVLFLDPLTFPPSSFVVETPMG
jgi:hypothetical protein